MRPIFSIKCSTFSKTLVVDSAIPTAKAPTMGDRPMEPASAAAPKNDAVAIPSTLPLAFQSRGVTRRGIRNTEASSMMAKKASTWNMVIMISKMSISTIPESLPTRDVTTDRTAMASMSSTIAAPMISLASLDFIFPNSLSTWTEIAMLVAVSAVAISMDCRASNPNIWNAARPAKNGTTTPMVPTTNEALPPRRNSLGVISRPAMNRITIAPISPRMRISPSSFSIDSPL